MKFIDGGNLAAAVVKGEFRRPEEVVQLMIKVAHAVEYAHNRGVVHRDLKPANILLDHDSEPFVSDFGFAKFLGKVSGVTISRTLLGTLAYMSPEQAESKAKEVTPACDNYALGAILYDLLSGHPPFEAETDLQLLEKIVESPVPSIRLKRPDIDADLEAICLKCLEKSSTTRYASAGAFAADLTRFLAQEPVLARRNLTIFTRTKWADPVFSRDYRERADRIIPERLYLFHVALSFYRYFIQNGLPQKSCDLGCGDGVLAQQLLTCDPGLVITLADGSEEMLSAARRRMHAHPNVEFVRFTFSHFINGEATVGPFNFIASAFAIHHHYHPDISS
jgi:serine/threonine protein kinase